MLYILPKTIRYDKTPEADLPVDHVRAYYAARLRAPGERFRAAFAETLTKARLDRANQRVIFPEADAVLREGIAEITALRIRLALNPLFQSLQRLENKFAIVAAIRDDPYAPDPRRRDLIQTR